MSSKVQICNMALAKLGVDPIVSLSDNTDAAKRCDLIYDDIADEVMADGAWSSTIARAELAKTVNTPAFGFTDEFQLPTNPKCLRVLEINEEAPGTYAYRIEGDKLLANINTMFIKYVSRVTDTESYDLYLKRAIEFRLAAELAYPLTGDLRLADRMMRLYEENVMKGLATDGTQGSSDSAPSSDLTEIR